ncbi:hypothetical protein [Megamonas hypermegale]|uniref:hypothetical protein n=1 Tax=Megamonas hypermegale TaxID=158847 RepID=UPI0026EDB9CC|nr:hypothetical protein [Megamonas hypermegale]
MEDLLSFLFFVAIIVLNGLFQNARRKACRQSQPPPIPPDLPKEPQPQPAKSERTLDYMMAKPQESHDKPVVYTEPEFIPDPVKEEPAVQYDINNVYQEYLQQKKQYRQENAPTDYIQRTQIRSADTKKKMQIDIERENIMNAIMYAQVLEMPKSVYYLKRYGIKRIIHKD